MFWSHDLLGKKSPLAAVWVAAHGKKLNKGKVLQVNVAEACKAIMEPEAPQALRLQAILVGGIVILHRQQQYFLIQDAQEMLHRLRSLGSTGGGEEGPGAAKVTLGGEKRAAREEAITLPITGDMALLGLGELFPTFPTQGPSLSQGPTSSGLFVMPSLPEGTASEAGTSGRQKGNRRSRRGAAGEAAEKGGGGGLLLGRAEEGEVALHLEGLPHHGLELMDGPEVFAVPDDLPGMDFFGGRPGGGVDALPDDLLPVPSGLGLGEGPPGGSPAVDGPAPPPASQTPESSAERSGGSSRGGAPKAQKRRAGGKKKGRPTVDDLESLQIRGKEYREWQADRSDITVHRPQRALLPGAAAAAKSALAMGPATAAAMPGGAWPAELQELFLRNATLPKADGAPPRKKGKKGAAAAEEEEDELERQERYLDQLAAGGAEHTLRDDGLGFAGEGAFGFGGLEGDYGGPFGGGYAEGAAEGELGAGPRGEGAFQRQLRERRSAEQALSGSEEEADVETERLRAALNSTQGLDANPFHLQQLGLTPASASSGRAAGARGKRGSSVLRRDSEGGVMSEKSSERRGSSRLGDLHALGEGAGGEGALAGADLGGLLPAVGEDEEFLEEEEGGGGSKRQRTGEGTGTYGTLSQFELLEASGPTQELGPFAGGSGPGGGGGTLNRNTHAFVGLLRGRFNAAESQLGEGGEGPAELSLDDMTERLSRLDASKAFYQVLVARSAGFLELEQEEPYGDITLRRGPFM